MSDARPMQGRVCLITGATSGIGQESAVGLARLGARVVMGGRDAARAEAAREDVVRRSGSDAVEVLLGDLASLADVRRLAREVRERFDALHVLVNNAGVVNTRRELTVDGYEAMFAVNHLAHFLLTLELLPLLERAAPARIVNVSSDGHRFGRLQLSDLQSEAGFGFPVLVTSMRVYGGSKLANVLFTRELARRLEGRGVTANALHPGAVATRLGTNNLGSWYSGLPRLLSHFFLTPERGAATSLHLASSPDVEGVSGAYFTRSREVRPSAAARDEDLARELWKRSCEMVGIPGDPTP